MIVRNTYIPIFINRTNSTSTISFGYVILAIICYIVLATITIILLKKWWDDND